MAKNKVACFFLGHGVYLNPVIFTFANFPASILTQTQKQPA